MQIFINEKSLHAQFTPHTIERAIRNLLTCLRVVRETTNNFTLLTTQSFFNHTAIPGVHLQAILSTNQQLKNVFIENIKAAVKWENQRFHNLPSAYFYNSIDYFDSSIGEVAERKIQNAHLVTFLLNFTDSIFAQLINFTITRDDGATALLECSCEETEVVNWLIRHGIINPAHFYDVNSKFPPRDYQTILRDETVFELTHFRNQGRKVYRRKGLSQLWVVDNLHFGREAHIEVFDEDTKAHLGTSTCHEINLNTRNKVKNRYL
jgi:hypothetical protein